MEQRKRRHKVEETWDTGGEGSGLVGTQPGLQLTATRNSQTRASVSDYKLAKWLRVLGAHFWGLCLDFP